MLHRKHVIQRTCYTVDILYSEHDIQWTCYTAGMLYSGHVIQLTCYTENIRTQTQTFNSAAVQMRLVIVTHSVYVCAHVSVRVRVRVCDGVCV